MFDRLPKIIAHVSALNKGNFVLNEYILNKTGDSVNLLKRYCPHRMYPLHNTGDLVQEITCKFHNFKWNKVGEPINNNKKLSCGSAAVGSSGLIYLDFTEPNHKWVEDLSKEKNLEYSHSFQGTNEGSWLWLMEAEVDLLHVHTEGIHPFLSKQVALEDIVMDLGDGWSFHQHPTGWWLYIYPFTFIEYGNPGMLMVNNIVPKNKESEFGYDWISQYYYDPSVDIAKRFLFETAETVFKEDVEASSMQKGPYFPLMKSSSKYEDQCVHFGKWVKNNINFPK